MPNQSYHKSGSVTRPANTTQYEANDAISDSASDPSAIEITDCSHSATQGGWILGCQVLSSANQPTLPQLEVYVFDTSAPTATNDNAEFGLTDADAANLVAMFVLNTFADLDPTSGADGNAVDFAQPEGDFAPSFRGRRLWVLIKVTNAYTPVSAEQFTVQLHLLHE